MRPPDLPGGNLAVTGRPASRAVVCFNEAAGFTRRKRIARAAKARQAICASMRPPDLPGGNSRRLRKPARSPKSFNEAAGFTRRKRRVK